MSCVTTAVLFRTGYVLVPPGLTSFKQHCTHLEFSPSLHKTNSVLFPSPWLAVCSVPVSQQAVHLGNVQVSIQHNSAKDAAIVSASQVMCSCGKGHSETPGLK